jgi:hypothetical protein
MFIFYKDELKGEQSEIGVGQLQLAFELQDKIKFCEMNRKIPLIILLI